MDRDLQKVYFFVFTAVLVKTLHPILEACRRAWAPV
jgi:hypothetical protein